MFGLSTLEVGQKGESERADAVVGSRSADPETSLFNCVSITSPPRTALQRPKTPEDAMGST